MEQPQINQTTTDGGGANTVLIVIVIIILLVGGYFLFDRNSGQSAGPIDDGNNLNVNVDLPGGSDDGTADQGSGDAGGAGY